SLVSVTYSTTAVNDTGSWKIGTWDVGHEIALSGLRIVDEMDRRLADLFQIVRWHIRRHAYGDTVRSVNQKVGYLAREVRRFFTLLVVIGDKIHRFLVDVLEKCFGERRHPRFGISHRRRWISVYRSKIALAIDERVAI